jgi:hypothetical protein
MHLFNARKARRVPDGCVRVVITKVTILSLTHLYNGRFRVNLRNYFTKCNEMDRRVKNNNILDAPL